jgi:branched-chain amino acid transport system substrate-binding protein
MSTTLKRRSTALVALAAAVTLGLAACGSSSSSSDKSTGGSSGSGGSGNNANSAEGFSANSITVEGDIVKTSSVGYSQKLAELGAQARFTRANDAGGVNGRKIKYLGAADNHLDPAQDLPTVKKIIQQDKAFAVVPLVSPVLATGGQYLVQNKIPFFGWAIAPSFCNNDYGFGFSGCLVPSEKDDEVSTASAGLMDKLLGQQDGTGKSVALISEDSTSGVFGIKVIQAAFVADKWKVTYAKASISAASPTTDYSPFTQAILSSNGGKAPDVVFHVTTAPNVLGLEAALNNAGFKGPQENATTYAPSYLATAQTRATLEGGYVFLQYGSFQGNGEASKQMLTDVQKVDPTVKELTQDIAIGYYSADIFIHGLEKAGKTLSRAALVKALNDDSSYEVPGGLGKISFPAAHKNSVPCGSLVQIKGGKYIEKVPLTCFTNTSLSVLGS